MKKTILTLISIGIFYVAFGQSLLEKRAQYYYSIYDFDKSIELYEKLFDDDKITNSDAYRNVAQAHVNLRDYLGASKWYHRLIYSNDYEDITSKDHLNYFISLVGAGLYDRAISELNTIYTKFPEDTIYSTFIGFNHNRLNEIRQKNVSYSIEEVSINSDFDEFSPTPFGSEIVFLSNSFPQNSFHNKYIWDNKPFLSLFKADRNIDNSLEKKREINTGINNRFHQGPTVFSSDLKEVYFTSNLNSFWFKGRSNDGTRPLKIYYSKYDNQTKKWSKPKDLAISSDEYNYQHPTLSQDGNKLVFSSNMPGGYGGYDLWIITKNDDGTWGSPKNLGKNINTPMDESFPFISAENNLFYSSNGLPGLGRLDIYKAMCEADEWINPVNIGAPLNSQYDDFGLFFDPSTRFGYFSSDRPASTKGDNIFSFFYTPSLKLNVTVIDKATKLPLPNAMVSVLTPLSMDTVSLSSDVNGKVSLPPTVDYNAIKLTCDHEDYVSGIFEFKYQEKLSMDTTVMVTIEMENEKPQPLSVGTFIRLPTIYFDRDKSSIRPNSYYVLDTLLGILIENPNIVLAVEGHTDCRHSKHYNYKLSLERSQAVVNYLVENGISPDRLIARGFGETRLLIKDCNCEPENNIDALGIKKFREIEDQQVRNCSESDHQKNRRTEFRIIENNPNND